MPEYVLLLIFNWCDEIKVRQSYGGKFRTWCGDDAVSDDFSDDEIGCGRVSFS